MEAVKGIGCAELFRPIIQIYTSHCRYWPWPPAVGFRALAANLCGRIELSFLNFSSEYFGKSNGTLATEETHLENRRYMTPARRFFSAQPALGCSGVNGKPNWRLQGRASESEIRQMGCWAVSEGLSDC
jgi:hypothetical protein